MRQLVKIVTVLAMAAYPLLVYFGLKVLPLSYIGYLILGLATLRLMAHEKSPGVGRTQLALAGLLFLLAIYTLLTDDARGFRYYPVLINFALLVAFGSSLMHGQSMIERLARLSEPNLPQSAITYTRTVTQVWCCFFLVNGLIAGYTAAFGTLEMWAFYNGLLSYVLMGCLLAGEWLVRRSIRGKTDAAPH